MNLFVVFLQQVRTCIACFGVIWRKNSRRKVFVHTNIPFAILKEISDYNHVALMLSEPDISVNHFFDQPDLEKQFWYQRIMEADEEFPRLFGKTFYAIIRY